MSPPNTPLRTGLHVIIKPIGPVCNLRCAYCFYLEKEGLYPKEESWRMTDETLRAFVRQYFEAQPPQVRMVDFAFQGGEPTLMGLDFFRRVVELQTEFAPKGVGVRNALQTNGILLDGAWCEFLREHRFLVGLSLDGPAPLHDAYRLDASGGGTHARVAAALDRMKEHGVESNVLTCVHRKNATAGSVVYRHLRGLGAKFLQFIPIVEPLGPGFRQPAAVSVSERSVRPEEFGRFLIRVFDEWIRRDVGEVFVRDFDEALAGWCGEPGSLCAYQEHCGNALALEHNGDVYACDHFVTEEHKRGNLHETPLLELARSERQVRFGRDKADLLPETCLECEYWRLCRGGCPKDRIVETSLSGRRLNYLCPGFKLFFSETAPLMRRMAEEVRQGRPPRNVMRYLRGERTAAVEARPVGRNDPCPCGSGKKYKQCCLKRPPRERFQ